MSDLLVKGGSVVRPTGVEPLDIYIREGTIAAIGRDLPISANQEVDATNLHVLPGGIDTHVHFRDPGFTDKEDFGTGTAAAAFGGVTTIIDMPNTDPFVRDAEAVRGKVEAVRGKAFVDFALWGCAIPDNLDELEALAESGIVAYKAFMGESVRTPILEDGLLVQAFEKIAKLGLPIGVHAENGSITRIFSNRVKGEGRTDGEAHLAGRPNISEAEAIGRAIVFAEQTGVHLHICHLSTAEGLELVDRAKRLGIHVTAETCPHYLLLTDEDMREKGSWLKVNPPVRTKNDVEALWQGLRTGVIDAMCTDHGPRLEHEKTDPDIWKAVSGLHGVETNVPLMLTAVSQGRMTLEKYVEVACETAARTFGLFPRKGAIRVGSDADLAIMDLNWRGKIDRSDLHTKVKISPFEGFEISARTVHTIVRGEVIVRNRELAPAPKGAFIAGRSVQ